VVLAQDAVNAQQLAAGLAVGLQNLRGVLLALLHVREEGIRQKGFLLGALQLLEERELRLNEPVHELVIEAVHPVVLMIVRIGLLLFGGQPSVHWGQDGVGTQ